MALIIAVICISIFLIFSYIIDTQKKHTEYILQKNKKILDEKKFK